MAGDRQNLPQLGLRDAAGVGEFLIGQEAIPALQAVSADQSRLGAITLQKTGRVEKLQYDDAANLMRFSRDRGLISGCKN